MLVLLLVAVVILFSLVPFQPWVRREFEGREGDRLRGGRRTMSRRPKKAEERFISLGGRESRE